MATLTLTSPSTSLTLPKINPFFTIPFHSSRHLNGISLHNKSTTLICHAQSDGSIGRDYGIDEPFFEGFDVVMDDDEEESDEEDNESSVDLLIRFLQSLFKKVSKRAKKASRSILPVAIPPQLVSFAVDGILLLTSLSIVKAFLEVICTLGGTVFAVILFLRVLWATVSFFQSSNQNGRSFGAPQPIT